MPLANCKECGKLFLKVASDICPECQRKEEEDFNKVKEYLKEHPNANLSEIMEATGVGENKISKFIRAGRLSIKPTCESCGRPIDSGRLCPECRIKLLKEVRNVLAPGSIKEYEDTFLLEYFRKKKL
ncbi:MAG: MerR family transcriptional regulator [bacterium]|nr:MerR family transcriptional regulator [bacterium]